MEWLRQRLEVSRGGGANNVRPMEGLRGFAVFLVFLVHYVTLVEPYLAQHSSILRIADSLRAMGHTGVDLFFVLSGFLIYGSLMSRPQRFRRFMQRRAQRIYPAFAAVFVMYIILSFVFPAESKLPRSTYDAIIYLVLNLLLLPGLLPMEPMITVAWSLSYEMFYYFVIPLVITLFKLRHRTTTWRVSFFSLLAAVTVIYCACYGGHVRLIMFISGILLHEALSCRRIPALHGFVSLGALVGGLLGTLVPITGPRGAAVEIAILFASFFLLCFGCFRHPTDWLARAFSVTPLRWLGNMSYSYYLLHGLALKGVFLAVSTTLSPTGYGLGLFALLLPIAFALTLIPTVSLFLAVERPLSLAPSGATRTTPEPAEAGRSNVETAPHPAGGLP